MPRYSKMILALATAATLAMAASGPARAEQVLTPSQEEAVRRLILETIRNNPQIVAKALELFDEQQRNEQRERAAAVLAAHGEALFADPDTPVLGNADGDVILAEFFDYQCTYCKAMLPRLREVVEQDGNFGLALKELPILGPVSTFSAKAALAARKQGKYVPFHNALMATRGRLDEETVLRTAREVGLDVARLKQDMDDPAIEAKLEENQRLAATLGITGTPAFVTPRGVIPGAIDAQTLKAVIAEERQRGS